MKARRVVLVLFAAVGAAALVYGARAPLPAGEPQSPTNRVAGQTPVRADKADGAEAGITKITAEYEKAFNAADAKAAAALWTDEGEYVGADGEPVTGRAAIEKSLAEFFKANPKAAAEVRVESVRVLGRGTASAEGVVRLKLPGSDSVTESRYSALHVLEDGAWRAASVREWVPDPVTSTSPKHLDWLIGEWTAKGAGGELKLTYAWDENKAFIHAKYTVTKDDKVVISGTQVIGRNPEGGLRSWLFDGSGVTSEGVWVRDDKRWISEAEGLLPDGTKIASVNVLVPINADTFTWQTTDRTADGVPLPALPPVKVTRVKK